MTQKIKTNKIKTLELMHLKKKKYLMKSKKIKLLFIV